MIGSLLYNLLTVLALANWAHGLQIAKSNGLQVDVYHAPPLPVVYQNSTDLEFSPTTYTLIQGDNDAVLVDAPATEVQINKLGDWVAETLHGKNLRAIYITHGHGDHFLGAAILQQRFPGVSVYTTRGVYQHIEAELAATVKTFWESLLPGQIPLERTPNVDILPDDGEFDIEGHSFRAVSVGQGDISNATVLHVPDLDLVVTGDVVYGNCFQFFEETNTPALQDLWLQSLDKIEKLHPLIVIPSHMQPGEGYGPIHLRATRQYILDWKAAAAKAGSWQKLEKAMKMRHPERIGSLILRVSAQELFHATF